LLSIEKAKAKTMDLAIQLYRNGKIGLSKAAEISGSSIARFEDQLILYTKDDLSILKSEIENAMGNRQEVKEIFRPTTSNTPNEHNHHPNHHKQKLKPLLK